MNIKWQCWNCGDLKLRTDVKSVIHTDERTYFYKCVNTCKTKDNFKDWIIQFPTSVKKLEKFLEENPEL